MEYGNYVGDGDGDAKTFKTIVDVIPYGEDFK